MAYADPILRAFAEIILETGMRPDQLHTATRDQVHLDPGNCFFQVLRGKTKSAKRNIPLTARAKEFLSKRISRTNRWLFPDPKHPSKPISLGKLDHLHDKARRRVMKFHKGLLKDFRLYDCRHSWATRAAQSGMDATTLAAMLGHKDLRMVSRYAHIQDPHRMEAMEKFQRYVAEQEIAERGGEKRAVN